MRVRTTRDLAAVIRGTRLDLSMTQEQLAARCGLSRRTIGDLESTRSTPRFGALLALCDALDLDIELVSRPDTPAAVRTTDTTPVDLDAMLKDRFGDD
jgi:transcriptional regulator with XRE-family HTH domain